MESKLECDAIGAERFQSLVTLQGSPNVSGQERDRGTLYFSSTSNHLSAKFIWNITGAKLEVFSYDHRCSNRLISYFDFGQIFNDPTIAISHVIRLTDRLEVTSSFRHPYKLIAILSLTNFRSYICILDIRLNKILNTIDFPFNVSCAEVILSGAGESTKSWPISRELTCMNGIVALGCESGLLFLLDLLLDSYSPVPLVPKQVFIFTCCSNAQVDLSNKRRTANFHNQVICIPLNTDARTKGRFNYRSADGQILHSYLQNQVYISALHYIPQLSLLCLGYNFGGFHLINLKDLKMEVACGLDAGLSSVVSFAYQAPENDPRQHCYMWVVRGACTRTPNVKELPLESYSTAFLYTLIFENKEYIENYGFYLNDCKKCSCEFEFPLTVNPFKNLSGMGNSRLLDCFTVHQVLSTKISEEDMSPVDFNYLFMAWETCERSQKRSVSLALFDLNQWYNIYTPKTLCVDDNGFCPFLSIYSLNSLNKIFFPDQIQAVYFDSSSLSRFNSNLFYVDMHAYPLSVSFNITVASNFKICNVSFLGYQKKLISEIVKAGPSILLEPENLATKCSQYGLSLPDIFSVNNSPRIDKTKCTVARDLKAKRELLLNTALENNMTSWLISVIKEWATGEYSNLGCNLKHLLDWIWGKVSWIKSFIDQLTQPLFDMSGCNISQQDQAKLVSLEGFLSTLSFLLKQLQQNSTLLTQQGFDELNIRLEVIELIRSYLKYIFLFEDSSLLPEQEAETSNLEDKPFYSYEGIHKVYCERRQYLLSVNPRLFQKKRILLIDLIVGQFEAHLSPIWKQEQDSTDSLVGLYPPPNVHSLLQIFLLENVPQVYKETILFYFLFDLWHHLNEQNEYAAQRIMVFISTLNISQELRQLVQGLWWVDHQKYDSAMQSLTHPMVTSALTEFKCNITLFHDVIQHIVQLFLFENEFKSALVFTMCCDHFLLDTEQNENLYIQMLLLNDNLTAAFEFQRQRRSGENSYQVLYKLFFVCEKINSLVKICKIPLDSFEEKVFIDYLLNSKHINSKAMLVLYLVLNNKLLEAINIVKEYEREFSNGSEENKQILHLIEAYSSVLPHSMLDLANEISSLISNTSNTTLPVTYSTQYTTIKVNPKTKSITKVSSSRIVERMLEANEGVLNEKSFSSVKLHSSFKNKKVYLSPNVSKLQNSRVVKAKNASSARKDLFSVLKTPEVKRKIEILGQIDSNSKKPSSILKGAYSDTDSERGSEIHKQLKVSFDFDGKDRLRLAKASTSASDHNQQDEDHESESSESFDPTNEDPFATPSKRKSKTFKKSLDTPTHRMTLRSKK